MCISGCVSQEDIKNIANETNQTESDLGQCFSAYKQQLFGIYVRNKETLCNSDDNQIELNM